MKDQPLPMITFDSVSKHFGPYTAIDDVTFDIDEGEIVVITGPSGAGKTSLMRLLTHEYTPDEGKIFFDDIEVTDLPKSQLPLLRREIGVVFQDYKLLNERTVWENIELALDIVGTPHSERDDRIFDLLELVGIDDKIDLFPSQLSGGEAQRVAIARALATAPEVIFADEPTGNLDAETAVSITKLLAKINSLGTTLVIATHDANVLETLGDVRILKLSDGYIDEDVEAQIRKRTTTPKDKNSSEVDEVKEEDNSEEKEVSEKNTDHEKTDSNGFFSKIFSFLKKKDDPAVVIEEEKDEENDKKDKQ